MLLACPLPPRLPEVRAAYMAVRRPIHPWDEGAGGRGTTVQRGTRRGVLWASGVQYEMPERRSVRACRAESPATADRAGQTHRLTFLS